MIKSIPITKLVYDSSRPRSGTYHQLCDSIEKHGFLGYITIDKDYKIIDGLHRFWAARDCGLDEIPCQIVSINDVKDIQIMQSIHRVETLPIDYARQLDIMLTRMTVEELAQKLGKSSHWITQRLQLLNIKDERIQELINIGKIHISNAYALNRLPVNEHLDWVDRAMTTDPNEFAMAVNQRLHELRHRHTSKVVTSQVHDEITVKKDDHLTDILRYTIQNSNPCREITLEPQPSIIVRSGWDNVTVDGRLAYCRGDILVYFTDKWWTIDHPVLKTLNNESYSSAEEAMETVEKYLR